MLENRNADADKIEIFKCSLNRIIPEKGMCEVIEDYPSLIIQLQGKTPDELDLYFELNLLTLSSARILSYYIAKKYIGRGIGSKIYSAIESYLMSCGIKTVDLYNVRPERRQFWKRNGYVQPSATWTKRLQ